MKTALCDLPRYVESGPPVRSRWVYDARRALDSRPVRAFAGGLAAGIVFTLFAVLMLGLLNN